MFETVKQNNQVRGMVYLTSLMVSLIVHAAIICVLVVVPLVFFNVLQAQELLTFLIEPPPPPVPPPPPAPPAKASAAARGPAAPINYEAPERIPDGIPPADDRDVEPMAPAWSVPGLGLPGVQTGGTGFSIVKLLEAEPPKLEKPRPPTPPRPPVRVGTLEQSKLIYKVNPTYPPLAIKARVTGTVVLEALVDEEGNVLTIKALSGHAFLLDAAVQAVKQWKYSPTVLNGEPVPVIATVTVIFKLD